MIIFLFNNMRKSYSFLIISTLALIQIVLSNYVATSNINLGRTTFGLQVALSKDGSYAFLR